MIMLALSVMYYAYIPTKVGTLLCIGDDKMLHGLHWQVFKRCPQPQPGWIEDTSKFSTVVAALNEYLAGKRTAFDVPYILHGTPFQKSVWRELQKIPYGATTSYQKIATAIGNPKAVRAVGTAVGSNPMCIIVPCHRVLGSGNTLNGFAGGLDAKRQLLGIEHIAYNT